MQPWVAQAMQIGTRKSDIYYVERLKSDYNHKWMSFFRKDKDPGSLPIKLLKIILKILGHELILLL